jgi:peptidoglycan/xylan/chitin deacetylase (PgdA/CDA1 family)
MFVPSCTSMPNRRDLLRSVCATLLAGPARGAGAIPPRTVVLTCDDAVKSHHRFVGPLLRELGFRATFFVTHRWMDDVENFMTWGEIAGLHEMGFEIGNHAWTHGDFSTPRGASHLAGELALTSNELHKVGVPKPVSFAWCGNGFGPEGMRILRNEGFRLARRGISPEAPYGKMQLGPTFDPAKHESLLIPTTGDAYPDWTFEYFERVIAEAKEGQAVVLQFHGVPDRAHPWVHTPPENFRRYMEHLKEQQFRVIALRDLEPFIDRAHPADDPLAHTRFPAPKDGRLSLAVEIEQTRANLPYWTAVMKAHAYTLQEVAEVAGQKAANSMGQVRNQRAPAGHVVILPYPGGRHPRIGFREGAIDPLRGTKVSVFLPWDPSAYVVVDLPEAIFTNLGLTFLAHTHIPTIWNDRNVTIENTDWKRLDNGGLESRWVLPNGIAFGASIQPRNRSVNMELFLENGTKEPLTAIRAQVCVMLRGAPGFNAQTDENKLLTKPAAAVRDGHGRWIKTSWTICSRVWSQAPVPCIHSDPQFPNCPSGETVRAQGRLWFEQADGQAAVSRE